MITIKINNDSPVNCQDFDNEWIVDNINEKIKKNEHINIQIGIIEGGANLILSTCNYMQQKNGGEFNQIDKNITDIWIQNRLNRWDSDPEQVVVFLEETRQYLRRVREF